MGQTGTGEAAEMTMQSLSLNQTPVIQSQWLSLWTVGSEAEKETANLVVTTGVWRIIWGNPDRVILYGYWPKFARVFDLPAGANIELRNHSYHLPLDLYEYSEPVFIFRNCQLKRKWMPKPLPLGESHVLTAFSEFECEIVRHDI